MLYRFTMACCWKSIYKELKKVKPGTELFGSLPWKVIKALWLYEIVQENLFLLTGEAKIKKVQGSHNDWYLTN